MPEQHLEEFTLYSKIFKLTFSGEKRKIPECKGVISAFLSIALLYCLLFRVR